MTFFSLRTKKKSLNQSLDKRTNFVTIHFYWKTTIKLVLNALLFLDSKFVLLKKILKNRFVILLNIVESFKI